MKKVLSLLFIPLGFYLFYWAVTGSLFWLIAWTFGFLMFCACMALSLLLWGVK